MKIIPGNTKLFIYQSLCPHYKLVWSKNKRLHAMKQILKLTHKYVNLFLFIDLRVKKVITSKNLQTTLS